MRHLVAATLLVLLFAEACSAKEATAGGVFNALFGGVFQRRCKAGACLTTTDCPLGQLCLANRNTKRVFCNGSNTPPERVCGLANVTYVPGKAVVSENGLILSQGLRSRLIAESGKPVRYANGQQSSLPFHTLPDGAAVFVNPQSNAKVAFKYLSNSEDDINGGVGALSFDARGNVIQYERLLSGTKRNCGGGKTFWNTWLSCEEVAGGQIYEVDPFANTTSGRTTNGAARKTTMGKAYPALYESAAYDNRNPNQPVFYATIDAENGPLLRYTPPAAAVTRARNSNNYTQLLHSTTVGTHQYLLVQPNAKTYSWTTDVKAAEQNAKTYYKNCEGLDIRNGLLYMTCKVDRQLYILNLDTMTYSVSSTASGAFGGQPDQVARLLNSDEDMLYFCEDTDKMSGVHGRDKNGKYYSILQADGNGGGNDGETSGVAFSPGNHFMYVSFQHVGKIFEIRRTDGRPFSGQRLDIKYHDDATNDKPFAT